MSLWALAWAPLEIMVNRVLKLDPDAVQRMAPLLGKVVAVEVTNMPRLVLAFHAGAVRILPDATSPPQVTITVPMSQLLRTATSGIQAGSALSGVAVQGDAGTVSDVKDWLDAFQVDWEEQLGTVIGPELARPVAHLLSDLQQWARATSLTVRSNVEEYVRDESNLVPDVTEVQHFGADVEGLRKATEQLALRVQRLRGSV